MKNFHQGSEFLRGGGPAPGRREMSVNTWPFTRSSPGVGGERLACRVSGVGGLDDRTSVLSRPWSSSRGPRTVNDPYTPSPCCETNGPLRLLFFSPATLERLVLRRASAVPRPSRIGSNREASRARKGASVANRPHTMEIGLTLVLQLGTDAPRRVHRDYRVGGVMPLDDSRASEFSMYLFEKRVRARSFIARQRQEVRVDSCSFAKPRTLLILLLLMRERRAEGRSTA